VKYLLNYYPLYFIKILSIFTLLVLKYKSSSTLSLIRDKVEDTSHRSEQENEGRWMLPASVSCPAKGAMTAPKKIARR
jgi:hypothetical protein